MARSYRQNFIVGQSFSTANKELSQKVFSGWAFAILGENALKRKQTALTVDFKVTKLPRPSRGAVAQLVERPSKVPIWCNSTTD